MNTTYEFDVIAWAQEQAHLLRTGQFSRLDIERIAEEIEDVGKNEMANRMAVLLAHLLKWQLQPERRGNSWRRTIKEQRKGVTRDDTPSLKARLLESKWWQGVWSDAVVQASQETGLGAMPETCPWTVIDALNSEFLLD